MYAPFKSNPIEQRKTLHGYRCTCTNIFFQVILVILSLSVHPVTQFYRITHTTFWKSAVSMLTLKCAQQLELSLPYFLVQNCGFIYTPFKFNSIELCNTLLGYRFHVTDLSFQAVLVIVSLAVDPSTQFYRINLQTSWNSTVTMLTLECAQQLEIVNSCSCVNC